MSKHASENVNLVVVGLESSDQVINCYLVDHPPQQKVGLFSFAFGLQITSEAIEFLAGAMGAKYGGASKKGMFGALVGGIIGTIVGTILIPIPLFGSLMGSIIGSFGVAFVVEHQIVKNEKALTSAMGAAIGRALGVLSKIGFTLAMLMLFGTSILLGIIF